MTRDDFVKLIDAMGLKTGAELGVAGGNFSQVLAGSGLERLFLVDKWNDHHGDAERLLVSSTFRNDPRVTVMHSTFTKAVLHFHPGFFDFIYIDGYAHTGQEGGQTLDQWWPRLASGGLFAGHDYHPVWQPTINAVNRFCATHGGLRMGLTSEQTYPSWFIFKA